MLSTAVYSENFNLCIHVYAFMFMHSYLIWGSWNWDIPKTKKKKTNKLIFADRAQFCANAYCESTDGINNAFS